jgi:methylmalonyl-CoA/ethylmalonyl-CoA epimerase
MNEVNVCPLLSGNDLLHHLGFVVPSISAVAKEFAASMSANWDGSIVPDLLQKVRVAFFPPVNSKNPVFELVEPASQTSPVRNFLQKGGGLHHACYEVDDLADKLTVARSTTGWAIVGSPKPAAAFGGRRIAWVCSRNGLLIEFLERGGQ